MQQICLAISLNQVIQTRGFVFLFIFYFYVYLLYLYLYFYIISMLNYVLYLCLFPLSTSTQHFLLIGLSAPADSLMLPLFAARTHTNTKEINRNTINNNLILYSYKTKLSIQPIIFVVFWDWQNFATCHVVNKYLS